MWSRVSQIVVLPARSANSRYQDKFAVPGGEIAQFLRLRRASLFLALHWLSPAPTRARML